MAQQLELPSVPRRRVRLDETPAPPQLIDRDMLDRMAARRLEEEIGYTAWESGAQPPSAGFWEVTDHLTGTALERWWWDPIALLWTCGDPFGMADRLRRMTHAQFRASYAWRGLRQPHPDWKSNTAAAVVRAVLDTPRGRVRLED